MSWNYRPLVLSPFGLVPMGAGVADAADLPARAGIAPIAAPYLPMWSGFYGGVNLGVISDRSSQSAFLATPVPGGVGYCWAADCAFSNKQTATGVLGGVQLGYNFQWSNLVYGIETDFAFSSAKKTTSGINGALPDSFWTAKTGVDSLGTARLRIGYAFDRMLVFATGGLAYADMRNSFLAGSPNFNVSYTPSEAAGWRTGYAVGGGVEYAFAPNWSVKAEGLYYDLGKKDHISHDNFAGVFGLTDKMTGAVGRLGLNYQFH